MHARVGATLFLATSVSLRIRIYCLLCDQGKLVLYDNIWARKYLDFASSRVSANAPNSPVCLSSLPMYISTSLRYMIAAQVADRTVVLGKHLLLQSVGDIGVCVIAKARLHFGTPRVVMYESE